MMTEIVTTATAETGTEVETGALAAINLSDTAQLHKVVRVDHCGAGDQGQMSGGCSVLAGAIERRRGVGSSHLVYKIRKRKSVWMAIQKESGLVVDEQTDLSRDLNDDVIVTNVRMGGEKITRNVKICD
jgi:hypothetical protein